MKRTASAALFATLLLACAQKSDPPARTADSPAQTLPPGHPAISTAAPVATHVPKAEGSNGRSVAEIWAQKAALKDSPVVVRGTVVKFLPGIMGKNWLHLRDGSGSRS